jgi:nitroreductase
MKDTNILTLIKNRKSIRKYQDKPIPKKIIDKIIEAGIWGPSVPSFLRIQPWKFIVITDKKMINKISGLILKKSKQSGAGVNILLRSSANIVGNAQAIFAIYNSGDMEKMKNKFRELYLNFAQVIQRAELSAISAAIQNMILMAESLGVGSCWLDMPLFCSKEINKLLNTNNELIAFLTLGYPAEKGWRSQRKPLSDTVRHIR